jgi:sulfonate transport system permease protein
MITVNAAEKAPPRALDLPAATTLPERSSRSTAIVAVPGWMIGIIVPLALALGWELLVAAGWADGRLLPPPSVIVETFYDLAASGELAAHVLATMQRVLIGFACGVAVGTILGAITGYSRLARAFLDPSLQALRNIPSIAWVPLFILWFARHRK